MENQAETQILGKRSVREMVAEKEAGFKEGASKKTAMQTCRKCERSIYINDAQLRLDGISMHTHCAKCADCNCQLSLSNFSHGGKNVLLCKTHYFQRFHKENCYADGCKIPAQPQKQTPREEKDGSSKPEPSKVFAEIMTQNTDTSKIEVKGCAHLKDGSVERDQKKSISDSVRPITNRPMNTMSAQPISNSEPTFHEELRVHHQLNVPPASHPTLSPAPVVESASVAPPSKKKKIIFML